MLSRAFDLGALTGRKTDVESNSSTCLFILFEELSFYSLKSCLMTFYLNAMGFIQTKHNVIKRHLT